MEFSDSFAMVVADYEKYVRNQETKGKEPVSFLKYAFGRY